MQTRTEFHSIWIMERVDLTQNSLTFAMSTYTQKHRNPNVFCDKIVCNIHLKFQRITFWASQTSCEQRNRSHFLFWQSNLWCLVLWILLRIYWFSDCVFTKHYQRGTVEWNIIVQKKNQIFFIFAHRSAHFLLNMSKCAHVTYLLTPVTSLESAKNHTHNSDRRLYVRNRVSVRLLCVNAHTVFVRYCKEI